MKAINWNKIYYPQTPFQVNTEKSKGLNQPKLQNASKFSSLLAENLHKQQKIKFSSHAQSRMSERGIQLSTDQVEKLESALDKAKQKGSREALFLLNDLAFVVSVKNKTVITTLDKNNMDEQIITNIDSAIILT